MLVFTSAPPLPLHKCKTLSLALCKSGVSSSTDQMLMTRDSTESSLGPMGYSASVLAERTCISGCGQQHFCMARSSPQNLTPHQKNHIRIDTVCQSLFVSSPQGITNSPEFLFHCLSIPLHYFHNFVFRIRGETLDSLYHVCQHTRICSESRQRPY